MDVFFALLLIVLNTVTVPETSLASPSSFTPLPINEHIASYELITTFTSLFSPASSATLLIIFPIFSPILTTSGKAVIFISNFFNNSIG